MVVIKVHLIRDSSEQQCYEYKLAIQTESNSKQLNNFYKIWIDLSTGTWCIRPNNKTSILFKNKEPYNKMPRVFLK